MNKFICFALFICSYGVLNAQEQSNYDNIELESKLDYEKSKDELKKAVDLVLKSTPSSFEAYQAFQFVFRWASGAEKTFTLDAFGAKAEIDNQSMVNIYMTSMVDYVIFKDGQDKDNTTIQLYAAHQIIDYANKHKDDVKMNTYLKKMIKAKDKDKLLEYIELETVEQLEIEE